MSIDILVGIRVLEFTREKKDLSQNHYEGFTRSKLSKNSSSDIYFLTEMSYGKRRHILAF